jgi:general secretion pathway protein E
LWGWSQAAADPSNRAISTCSARESLARAASPPPQNFLNASSGLTSFTRSSSEFPLTQRRIMDSVVQTPDLEKMAYFDHEAGVLYVSRNHTFDPQVRSYSQQLRSRGLQPQITAVAMDVIQQKRAQAGPARQVAGSEEPSEVQRQATDMFRKAVELRASDIHIRVAHKQGITRVFFRVHNDLEQHSEHTASWGTLLCSAIYTAMADISDSTYEPLNRQDGRISRRDRLPAGLDGIRIATTPQVDGNVMVLRLLYNDSGRSTDICTLGYSPEQKSLFGLMKRRPTGINIIAGPTGSGKSTTLQRTLLSIHQECNGTKHIITVEDPPEYPMPGIVQTPVANAITEAERSAAFQAAIKAAMRLDPNVIMIGEMRDPPSARLGVQAAMTGHQVWTTVHANNVFSIVDRMVDLGVPLNTMTDPTIVTGLICQRLLKVLCPHCRQPFAQVMQRYAADDRERVLSAVAVASTFVAGGGCAQCNGTGIAGRTVVAEVVTPDEELMELLRKGCKQQAIASWRARGHASMLDSAVAKVNAGLCDPFQAEEEVGPLNVLAEVVTRVQERIHAA